MRSGEREYLLRGLLMSTCYLELQHTLAYCAVEAAQAHMPRVGRVTDIPRRAVSAATTSIRVPIPVSTPIVTVIVPVIPVAVSPAITVIAAAVPVVPVPVSAVVAITRVARVVAAITVVVAVARVATAAAAGISSVICCISSPDGCCSLGGKGGTVDETTASGHTNRTGLPLVLARRRRVRLLRRRKVHTERAAMQDRAIHLVDNPSGSFDGAHGDEAETARTVSLLDVRSALLLCFRVFGLRCRPRFNSLASVSC